MRPTDTEVWRLLLYVRTVRNNLFHGGKYESGPVSDPSRDEELIRSCLLVIDVLLDLDVKVAKLANLPEHLVVRRPSQPSPVAGHCGKVTLLDQFTPFQPSDSEMAEREETTDEMGSAEEASEAE